jgi:PIN domain nuclease of toxin-antitoxin system
MSAPSSGGIAVLDACAMQALLRNEPGGEAVRDLLAAADVACYAHAINLCEVFYDFHRDAGETTAQTVLQTLFATALIAREDFDRAFWEEAGRYKSAYRRISLADCCAVALTLRVGGELVTCDHHELQRLADDGVCPIRFIR